MICSELGATVVPDACKVSLKDVKRIFYKLQSGDNSSYLGADEAAYISNIQDSANIDSEIAKTGVDKMVGSGEIYYHDLPEVLPNLFIAEDGTPLGADNPGNTYTLKMYGLTSDQIVELKKSHNKPVKFFFVCKGGVARVKRYENSSTDVFFNAEIMTVSDPKQTTGSETDSVTIQLGLEFGALNAFQDVENCAFMLSK